MKLPQWFYNKIYKDIQDRAYAISMFNPKPELNKKLEDNK